jgi:OOP family OmpA-OmpF porin
MKKIFPLLLLCLAYQLTIAQGSPETPAELTVIGTVYDEDTRNPIAASVVIKVKDYDALTVNTDAKGRFAVGIPAPSQCSIVAKADGFETIKRTYSFQAFDQKDSILRLNLHLVPIEKVKLMAEILNSKDNTPLNCQVKVHVNSDFSLEDTYQIFTGSYSKTFTEFGWYILEFSSPGFLTISDTVWVVNSHRRTIQKTYYLNPIELGVSIQLKNIYFNFSEATLKSESFEELNRVADLFKQNASLKFEIAGHTDSEGPDDYNLQLSQNRAQAIADYLISQGVSPSQLIVQGYGESKPIDSNLTAAGKLNNRRVEFMVAANTNQ